MDNISTRHIVNEVVRIASNNPAIEEVILFGSRAENREHPTSDFDLCIKADTQLDFYKAKLDIEDIATHFSFDIIFYSSLTDKVLLQIIDTKGVVLYERRRK